MIYFKPNVHKKKGYCPMDQRLDMVWYLERRTYFSEQRQIDPAYPEIDAHHPLLTLISIRRVTHTLRNSHISLFNRCAFLGSHFLGFYLFTTTPTQLIPLQLVYSILLLSPSFHFRIPSRKC